MKKTMFTLLSIFFFLISFQSPLAQDGEHQTKSDLGWTGSAVSKEPDTEEIALAVNTKRDNSHFIESQKKSIGLSYVLGFSLLIGTVILVGNYSKNK